jgi:broad specificity phosphatase PhoE
MTYLFLIRHGETPWTKERRFQGSTNTHLTPRGKKQAAAVAHCLKRYGIHHVYASDLWRARETAALISKTVGKKAVLDRRLRELGFGVWEGRTAAELLQDKTCGYQDWCRGKKVTPKGGEKIAAFRKRVRHFLKQIAKRHEGKKVAIVTHGGPVKIFLYEALKLPYRSLWSFRVEPASVTILGLGTHFSQVFAMNDTSHLPRHLTAQPEYVGS